MKTIDLKDCNFPVEQRCLFNPTHNTSITAAAGIFASGTLKASESNFRFVSLRYGVGAMYFNGVMLEFSIERLLAMAPMDIEVIDKTESLATYGYSHLSVERQLRLLTARRLMREGETVSFDNFPELRVKGDLGVAYVERVYVAAIYRRQWTEAKIDLPGGVDLVFVDLAATEEELYLVRLTEEELESDSALKNLEKLEKENPSSSRTREMDVLIRKTKERREEIKVSLDGAARLGLYLTTRERRERYTWDYNVLSRNAHRLLCDAYLRHHAERAATSNVVIKNYCHETKHNVYCFLSKLVSRNTTIIVELGGSIPDLPEIDLANTPLPDNDILLSAYSHLLHGMDCIFLKAARSGDAYYEALNQGSILNILSRYETVVLLGFCGSTRAVARFANERAQQFRDLKLVLSASVPALTQGKELELQVEVTTKNLFLIAWDAQETGHTMVGFDELKRQFPQASYAEIYDETAKGRRHEGQGAVGYYGESYFSHGGPVADDIHRFACGLPVNRERTNLRRIAAQRDAPTANLAKHTASPPPPRRQPVDAGPIGPSSEELNADRRRAAPGIAKAAAASLLREMKATPDRKKRRELWQEFQVKQGGYLFFLKDAERNKIKDDVTKLLS